MCCNAFIHLSPRQWGRSKVSKEVLSIINMRSDGNDNGSTFRVYHVILKNSILFCFFFYDTSEEKFLTSDLSFSQVTEVDKREPRESFSKPRPHFWGRGRRPRPRNEQAEAEKCSPRFPFVYWGNWGNLKSDVDKFLPKKVASTIIKTECFFHLSGFFVTLNRFSEWEKWKLD